MLSVASACKVLIEFSLLRLENPDEACAVSQVRGTTQNVTETLQYLEYFALIFALILRHSHQSPVIQFCSFMLTKTFTVNWWLTYFFKLVLCLCSCNNIMHVSFWSFLCILLFLAETPDSSNKRPLHWLQQTRSDRDHYLHCYDEVCQVASNYQDSFRWYASQKCSKQFFSNKNKTNLLVKSE